MRVEEIIEELNTLPQGYISKKKIKGKEYSYLQFSDGNKLKSVYVRESELDFYNAGIARRKELEAELKAVGEAGKTAPVLSQRARSLTGSIMSGNNEVARFENGEMVYCDNARAPLMLVRTGNIESYLASRAIDSSRTNSRLVKKIMDIHGEPDEMVSLYAHGATVTDNYWFRVKGSRLRYEDIRFDSDAYSEVALDGRVLIYNKRSKLSPQLTLGGSYEKCWRLIDDEWWLYKRGTSAEILSELISSRLAELMGVPTARYEYEDGYIRTKNFATEYNFEPMTSIAGDDDRPETVMGALRRLSISVPTPLVGELKLNSGSRTENQAENQAKNKEARDSKNQAENQIKNKDGCYSETQSRNPKSLTYQYLRLLLFDAVVNNVDRHNENCGLMREQLSGEIVGLAPNFDNNLSLFARSTTLNMDPKKDGLIQYLLRFVRNCPEAQQMYRDVVTNMPSISIEDIKACIDEIDEEVICCNRKTNVVDGDAVQSRETLGEQSKDLLCPEIQREQIAEYVYGRYRYLRNRKD